MKSPWLLAGLVLALACPAALAQDMSTTQSTTTSTTTASTMDTSSAMMVPMLDYMLLATAPYDYTELVMAKRSGYSDKQVATIAKISRLSGVSFREVYDAVVRGETFPYLAQEYNLNLNDVYEVNHEEDNIAAYKAAYEATGWGWWKNYHRMAYNDVELEAMEAKFASMYAAFPSTTVGPALTFAPNPQPPAPEYAAPPPVAYTPPAPAPMPVTQMVVKHTVQTHTTYHPYVVHHRHRRHYVRRRVHHVRIMKPGS